jgi:predicted O-methyltransferase YrrM
MNPQDPFSYKSLSKAHPSRVLYVLRSRFEELVSRHRFNKYGLPLINEHSTASVPTYESSDTAVEPNQMALLTYCLDVTEGMKAPIVEIGAYRGVTASYLASRTQRKYYAVDPYIGYGGAVDDMNMMQRRTCDLGNFFHLRMTSGQAAAANTLPTISFAFIDAVHDYVNVLFDGITWSKKLEPMGLIAFHDTDSTHFPGVQRAVFKLIDSKESPRLSLFAHTHGTVVLQRQE